MDDRIDAASNVLKSHRQTLHSKHNVVATGIGYKIVNGIKTDEIGIICSVTKKVSAAGLASGDIVPQKLEGVVVDVIETGKIRAFQAPTGRFRPAPGGVSIGHIDITAGTLGCVVKRNGVRMILSNNHVLANSNAASKGDPIIQPGPFDRGAFPADHIATLEDFVPIDFGEEKPSKCSVGKAVANILNSFVQFYGSKTRFKAIQQRTAENKVDAAIARPLRDQDILDEILNIGAITGVGNAGLGDALKKMGRTTGLTQGAVDQIDVSVNVSYGPDKVALFTEQIMAGGMSAGGDSGSAILDSNNKLVGLLFAGSETTTIINPIDFVFSALNLTL